MLVTIVVAMTPQRLIGKAGGLPWHLPADLQHFKRITLGHAVVMGRKTLDALRKPLKGRRNLIVTRDPSPAPREGVEWFPGVEAALAAARAAGETECMICGGSEIYRTCLERRLVDRMIITFVHMVPEPAGDVYFPAWNPAEWRQVEARQEPIASNRGHMEFVTLERLTPPL